MLTGQALAEAVNRSLAIQGDGDGSTRTFDAEEISVPPQQKFLRQGPAQSRLKPSGSSFGLHSPDNLPLGLVTQEGEAQVKQCH